MPKHSEPEMTILYADILYESILPTHYWSYTSIFPFINLDDIFPKSIPSTF